MNSKIEQLIDEIEAYIEGCKFAAFSQTKIVVEKEGIDELLRELRMNTPDEIQRYQKIISNKEAILNDARAKADALVQEATVHTNQLINEHEIMQQAYAQANEVVSMATRKAQEIVNNAAMEANAYRTSAVSYMTEALAYLENLIASSASNASANYERLITDLNKYRSVIQENRQQIEVTEGESEALSEEENVE